jgi:hypothetical protein
LNRPRVPVSEIFDVTAFGVGAWPASQFRFAASGGVEPPGKTVR